MDKDKLSCSTIPCKIVFHQNVYSKEPIIMGTPSNFKHYNKKNKFMIFKKKQQVCGKWIGPKKQAIGNARTLGVGIPVVSRQVLIAGAREFLVPSWSHFYGVLMAMKPEQRVYYELVQDENPCKLHIDVDAKLNRSNLDNDKKKMDNKIRKLISKIIVCMNELFPNMNIENIDRGDNIMDVDEKDSDMISSDSDKDTMNTNYGYKTLIIVLDASKGCKYSKHIIFNFESNAMFINHDHLRCFMHYFYSKYYNDEDMFFNNYNNDDDDDKKEDSTTRTFLCDMAIYKGDREFRMPFCTKKGQQRYLLLDYYYLDGIKQYVLDEKNVFFKSLIYFVHKGSEISTLFECKWENENDIPDNVIKILNKTEQRNYIRNKQLINTFHNIKKMNAENVDGNKRKRNIDDDYVNEMHDKYKLNVNDDYDYDNISVINKIKSFIKKNHGLDKRGFELEFHSINGKCLTLSSNSHYCEIKRDEHHSNHIYYVVWLDTKKYYQKCFNNECKNKAIDLKFKGMGEKCKNDIQKRTLLDDVIKILKTDININASGSTYDLPLKMWDEINTFLKKETKIESKIDSVIENDQKKNNLIDDINKKNNCTNKKQKKINK